MAKWRVYNKHPDGLTHTERFRDETVSIKAGSYVLMDYEDAVLFRGQYYPMKTDPMGMPSRETFKVLHLEPDGEVETPKEKFICPLTGKEFPTAQALVVHLKAYEDQVVTDPVAEEEIQKTKRGPGRPSKEKSA